MAKLKNDKYYTPIKLAQYCVNKTKEVIGEQNITEYIEPSGGNGVFLDFLPKNTYSCDIEPEDDRIIKQNFLTLDIEYKKGRCIIGNPPYGTKNNLTRAFYNKSCEIGDYISFILPISQWNNSVSLYKFDLIYSEKLGNIFFTDREVPCCFNIYKRNKSGELNKPIKYNLDDVDIIELRNNKNFKKYNGFDYDFAICAWGSIGKEVKCPNEYTKEFYFVIHNKQLKDIIIQLLKTTKWSDIYPMTATPNLLQWQVYKYLKEQIKDIK